MTKYSYAVENSTIKSNLDFEVFRSLIDAKLFIITYPELKHKIIQSE